METTRTYTRELIAGVRRYVAAQGPWSVFVELRALDSAPPPWLHKWDGDGILTRTFTQEMSDLVSATGLPAVELRATQLSGGRPFVGMDNAHIGRSVADHFHERGYRRFAAYGLCSERFFMERVANFLATARAYGCPCWELSEDASETVSDWELTQSRLVSWLQKLEKPVGIFAANDQLGVLLLEACQRAGIAVPEEVAVVGAENEETLCTFASPPLTSVRFDGQTVGYRAAELLDQMMQGSRPAESQILVSPRGILCRSSSDEMVIRDPLIALAARMIREEATRGLTVETLCKRLNASRSTLDRRMNAALGRSPKQEIRRIRLREVERLLRDTDLTLESIAELTGFTHSQYLHTTFKEAYGITPGRIRRPTQ